jgi:hypothetical protein
MPEQDGTWEIDWDALTREAWRTSSPYVWNTLEAKRVIEAYRRQQAEYGMVEVSLDFLNQVKEMVDWLAEPCTAMGDDQTVYDELARLAATTKDQP